MVDKPGETANWELATRDGARREALRCWRALSLEQIVAALEETQEITELFSEQETDRRETVAHRIQEPPSGYEPSGDE